jgi:hypothetical protein
MIKVIGKRIAAVLFSHLLVCSLLLVGLAQSARAGSILLYEFTGTATGTANGVTFSNATMVMNVTGDTSSVSYGGGGHYELDYPGSTATLLISGFGPVSLTDSGSVDDNQDVFGGAIGLYDNTYGWLVTIADVTIGGSAFASYALATPFGPSTPPQGFDPSVSDFVNVPTSGGPLTITSYDDVSFEAFATRTHTPIPEPCTLVLLGSFLGLGGLLRRRR